MKVNYRLLAKIRREKDREYLPPNVTIDYKHLGEVLEAKAEQLKNS